MELDKEYSSILHTLKERILYARLKAALSVNTQLLHAYWEIGKVILYQQEKAGWGTKVIDHLSRDLRIAFPDMEGLSVRNLKYMRAFAENYPDFDKYYSSSTSIVQPMVAQLEKGSTPEFVQSLVAQIPWTHNVVLLEKIKDPNTRLFYIRKTIENGWSRSILLQQIETELHKRQGKAITNFEHTLPQSQSDLAHETLKNPYVLEFLNLSEEVKEYELEKALTQHIKKLLLELGRGFAYVGNQHNVKVKGDDYFLDLLFYNFHLHCFVVFELKIGEFKPEYAGKLNFYVNTIDEQLKGISDKPTIGVLLCKTPNETVVKYALKGISTPIGVAEYRLLSKQMKGELPTAEELEIELEKEIKQLEKPLDKKLAHLTNLINKLDKESVKEKLSPQTTQRIVAKVLIPLKKEILKNLQKTIEMFDNSEIMIWTDAQGHRTDNEAKKYLKEHNGCGQLKLELRLRGFKPAGEKAFDCWKDIYINLESYKYIVSLSRNHNEHLFVKMYHQMLNDFEIKQVAENVTEVIVDDITKHLEAIIK